MKRNINGYNGMLPVEAATEFEVSGIKMFTYFNTEWDEWRVTELTSGFAFPVADAETESKAIEAAKAKIANVGPEKVMQEVRAMIARCGVANEEGKS